MIQAKRGLAAVFMSVVACGLTLASVVGAQPRGGASFLNTLTACQRGDKRPACQSTPVPGSIGSGPSFSIRSRMTRFQGGWAEDRTLFVGFGEKSVYRTEVAAVYSVDLVTGNRKVLSGGYVSNPGDEYSAQKVASVGSGPSFGIISVIRRLRPGKLFVRSYNGLFVVDEATGNRDKIAIDEASGCGKNVSLSADITSDGKVVMAYDDNRSSGISVFDMQTKKCLHHLQPYGESFYCPCGRLGPGVPGEPLR